MEMKPESSIIAEMCNHRRAFTTLALRILADPNNSEKSLLVLIQVMENMCKDSNSQRVFVGVSSTDNERHIGFSKFQLK